MEQAKVEIRSTETGPVAPLVSTPAKTVTPPSERPSWLPDGINSQEELVAQYAELKSKTPAQTPPQLPQSTLDKFEKEFAETGKLSDQSYADLEKNHGLTKAKVDQFIDGQRAAIAQAEAEVLSTVGGKENFTKIAEWAKTGLTKAELDAYNTVANGSDMNSIKLALAGLKSKYEASVGRDPNLLGGKGSTADGNTFRSVAELTRAINDPKYKLDPAYRKDVEERLKRSDVLAIS